MENELQSKYCYPGTEVLINNQNIKSQTVLNIFEAEVTRLRISELKINPIKGEFNLKHLKDIHRYIFQDVYPFAGRLREERIYKDNFEFANPLYINSCAEELFNKLKKEKYLVGEDIKCFSDRAAYYMSEVNVLHPFREGNGRSQREFIRILALKCGYKLDWNKVPKDKVMEASIRSTFNYKELSNIIEKSIVNIEPIKDLFKPFERNELER